jgi:hypothetical protein
MPSAIDPTDAQINIVKFNKSAIKPALVDFPGPATFASRPSGTLPARANQHLCDFRRKCARVDPYFY